MSISLSIYYFERGYLNGVFYFCFFGQTFRNNLNKILGAAYNRHEPWEMGVHKRNGTIYLDVHKLPERPQSDLDRRR
jgi:hypothetical protein